MKRRTVGLMMMVAIVAAIAGCSKPSIVGKWKGTYPVSRNANPTQIVLVLTKDGKFAQTTLVDNGERKNKLVTTGVYTAKDSGLTITMHNATVDGMALPAPANTTVAFRYKLDADTLTLEQESPPATIKMIRDKS